MRTFNRASKLKLAPNAVANQRHNPLIVRIDFNANSAF
jgi:hypothetical protein